MKKNLLGIILIILVVLGAWYFIGFKPKRENSVTIGTIPLIGNWPFYLAEEKGYFSDKGIDVDYTSLQSSNQIMDSLIRGDIQAGYFASLPALAAQSIDPDKIYIFAFGDYSKDNPFDAFLVSNDSTIRNLKQLEGKKLGVFPGSTGTNFSKKYLSERGVDVNKIEFVQLSPSAQLQALSSGAIDALHAYDLTVATALDEGLAKKIAEPIFADVIDHAAIGIVAIQAEWVDNNPELSKKFIDAYASGLKYGQGNPDAVRESLQDRLQIKPSVAKSVNILNFKMYDDYDFSLFSELARVSAELGDLTSVPQVDNLLYQP